MSSTTLTPIKENLFNTYLVNQEEPEEKKTPDEKPAAPSPSWKPGRYQPSRASWHTVRGKIESYLA